MKDEINQARILLTDLGLGAENSIIIGSGILQALELRRANDIDIVVPVTTYQVIKGYRILKPKQSHGHEVLTDSTFEIGTVWEVLGKAYGFNDLRQESIIIDGLRYIKPEFLLKVKQSWADQEEARDKDLSDIEILKQHLGSLDSSPANIAGN